MSQPVVAHDVRAAPSTPPVDSDPLGRRALGFVPAALIAGLVVWLLLRFDVAPRDIAAYGAYWIGAITVPGMIVHRALRGQAETLLADLGLGAATGLAIEVLLFSTASLVNLDAAAPWWFVLVYAGLVVSPGLRARVRTRPWPTAASSAQNWAIAAATAMAVLQTATVFRRWVLPPQTSNVNIDVWWHLGNLQEILRVGTPVDPRIPTEPLLYHFFSHVHMASASTVSGVEPRTVLLRLWILPIVLVVAALLVTLARRASGASWAGPVAAWIGLVGVYGGITWASSPAAVSRLIVPFSPSQTTSLVFVGAAAIGLLDASRRRLAGPEAAWLLLATLACVGVKPTAMPVLLCAMLLVTGVRLVKQRRLDPWLLGVTAVLAIQTFVLMPLFMRDSGTYSQEITLFAVLERLAPYRELIDGIDTRASSPGLVLDTLDGEWPWRVAVVTLGGLLVERLLHVAGLLLLLRRDARSDGAAWLLSGGLIAAWGAFLLLDGPVGGHAYFLSTAGFFGAALTAWWLVALVREHGHVGHLVIALVVGILTALAVRSMSGSLVDVEAMTQLDRIWIPPGAVFLVLVAFAVVMAWTGRSLAVGAACLAVALVGLTLPATTSNARLVGRAVTGPTAMPADPEEINYLEADAQEAALWLGRRAEPDDLVATNTQCRPNQPFSQPCDARGYWVSALSGQRILLEGWGYTGPAHAAAGAEGVSYAHVPSPWPDRLRLSQEVFTDPTAEIVDELRRRGVDWLLGHHRASDIDTVELSKYATPVFDNDAAVIFHVDPAG